MTTRRVLRLSVFVILACTASAVAQQQPARPTGVPAPERVLSTVPVVTLPLTGAGRPHVSVMIDGKGPFTFLFDTGASGTVITQRLFEQLGLPALGQVGMQRPGSTTALPATVTRLGVVELGGVRIEGLIAFAASLDHVLGGPDGPSGVLSPAALVGMLVTFDYPKQQLRFEAGSLPAADGRAVFEWGSDQRLPTVPLTIGDREFLVHVDTGATGGLKLPKSLAPELAVGDLTRVGNARQVDDEIVQHAGRLKVRPRLGDHALAYEAVVFQEGTVIGSLGIDVLREFEITLDLTARRARFTRAELVDGFAARMYESRSGATLPYRLFVPSADARRHPLPLVIYLHGGGGAGTDNLKQITGGNTLGTHLWTTPEMQARHPAFVFAPQLPGLEQWSAPGSDDLATYAALALEALAEISREFAIDANRVYLTGQSRGGRGVWDIVSKRPGLFAAAVPLCGDGSVARVTRARAVPIWAFHGARDLTIPAAGSRALVDALRASQGNVRYTEYPDVGHNVWTRAYIDPELPEWVFKQRR